MPKAPLFNAEVVRSEIQMRHMECHAAHGCRLCTWQESPTDPLVLETKYWRVIANIFPYDHVRVQLLIFPKRHIRWEHQLNQAESLERTEVMRQVYQLFPERAYVTAARSGEMVFSGASLPHFHIQLVIGDWDSEKFEPVIFHMAKRPKNWRRRKRRRPPLPPSFRLT